MVDDLHARLGRLENKIDTLNDAIATLARIDERMLSHMETARRLGNELEEQDKRITKLEAVRERVIGWVAAIAVLSASSGATIGHYLDAAKAAI